MQVTAIKTKIFRENEALAPFIRKFVKKLPEGSVLIVTSKIVALSEGRFVRNPGFAQKEKLIREQSEWAKKTKYAWLTVKDGMVMANAGIDESNANGKLLLLPDDSFASAARLRKELQRLYRIKKLGVIISDSHIAPLRAGVTAHALGYAGFIGIRDYRGKKDIFGKTMRISRTNVADSLATAAALEMGEGAERKPLAIISGASIAFTEQTDRKEVSIPKSHDLFGGLFL